MVSFNIITLALLAATTFAIPAAKPAPTTYPPLPEPMTRNHKLEARATYMDTVREWRSRLGLSQLAYNAQLEANAAKTVLEGNGQMKHQLNKGSWAQVLAPSACNLNGFYNAFVCGWLCERPNMPGMNGVCSTCPPWQHTSTGHADILISPTYKKIGCACYMNIWSCDLAG